MKATKPVEHIKSSSAPGGKCISLSAYIKTLRKSRIHDLMMQPEYFGKRE